MLITNTYIAKQFKQLADLLAIEGDNPFKIRAYRNASRTIANLPESLQTKVNRGDDIAQIPTIGSHISAKIREILQTGHLKKLELLKRRFPSHLTDLLSIEGIGPKRAKVLYESLGIDTLNKLRTAARAHRIQTLPGFSATLEAKILKGTVLAKKEGHRFLYADTEPHAQALERYLKRCPGILDVVIAGSFRRHKDTVGDLDIVTTSHTPGQVMECFVRYPDVREVILHGDTRSTVILHNDLQVDLRCVAPESFGATLHYFTGSKSHNIAIRIFEKAKGFKVNEYGIFQGKKRIAGATEEEFYRAVGLRYIEPELRERRGEIRAAREGTLPTLIEQSDLRGDLHLHTVASDGNATIEQMAEAGRAQGYAYLAITDHSRHLPIVHGLDGDAVLGHIEAIRKVDASLPDLTLLAGMEVDILKDGTLALPDSILKELDIVLVGVHDHFDLTPTQQTRRILKALSNPYVHILAYPTGRLIGQRAPYRLRYKQFFAEVAAMGRILEINAQPTRMDLDDIHIQRAKEAGIRFAISTDSHRADTLEYIRYGIYQARRGWLEKGDVINTRPLNALRKILQL